jgi:hypothetical protein
MAEKMQNGDLPRTLYGRRSQKSSFTHSGELTLGTWLLQHPTHKEIMVPPSTAGTHPLFSYI